MDEDVLRGLGSVGVDPHAQQRVSMKTQACPPCIF